jgi:hypothetical protein
MTYEEYLDEVTTLITEIYGLSDDAAIKLVMQAQAEDFFVQHDEVPTLRNPDQAKRDAAFIFKRKT